MVAGLAFFGFCVIYMLRVNLSVAIVAMTANKNHTLENGTIVVVRKSILHKTLREAFSNPSLKRTLACPYIFYLLVA